LLFLSVHESKEIKKKTNQLSIEKSQMNSNSNHKMNKKASCGFIWNKNRFFILKFKENYIFNIFIEMLKINNKQ